MIDTRQHYLVLDALRGLAALIVVLLHILSPLAMTGWLPHAGLAVDFFFLLSGFVVVHAYGAKIQRRSLSFVDFAGVRLVRLYPLALLGLVLGIVVYLLKVRAQGTDNALDAGWTAALNALFLPSPFPLGEGWGSVTPFNVPAWSLFFELIANALYFFVARYLGQRSLLALVVAFAAALLVLSYGNGGVATGGDEWNTMHIGLTRVGFGFFAGVLLYQLTQNRTPVQLPLAVAFICLVFLGLTLLLRLPIPQWAYEYVAALAIFPAIVWLGSRVQATGTVASAFALAGAISYPLYVLHYPIVRVFGNVIRVAGVGRSMTLYAIICIQLVLMILVAYGADRWFDRSVRRWVRQRLKQSPAAA